MIARLLRRLTKVFHTVGYSVFLPLLVALVTADVALRYIFLAPLSWGLEASKYIMLTMFLLGLVYSFQEDVHIRVDVIFERLPGRIRRIVEVLINLSISFVFSLIAMKAYEEAMFYYGVGFKSAELEMSLWPFFAGLTVISVCMVCFGLVHAARAIRGLPPRARGE